MSEGSHLGVGEAGEERDHRVHHVLVVDDAVLTLADQDGDKLAEVVAELLPHGAGHGQRVVAAVLQGERVIYEESVGGVWKLHCPKKSLAALARAKHQQVPRAELTSSNSSVILRMISAFCMFRNISILTVPGERAPGHKRQSPRVWPGSSPCTSRLTFTPGALDEEVDEVQQRQVSVLLVGLDPLVNHGLKAGGKRNRFS